MRETRETTAPRAMRVRGVGSRGLRWPPMQRVQVAGGQRTSRAVQLDIQLPLTLSLAARVVINLIFAAASATSAASAAALAASAAALATSAAAFASFAAASATIAGNNQLRFGIVAEASCMDPRRRLRCDRIEPCAQVGEHQIQLAVECRTHGGLVGRE